MLGYGLDRKKHEKAVIVCHCS